MVRWYAGCCRTPIGNTRLSPWPPYIGLVRRFMDRTADGEPVEAALGPVRGTVQTRFATGEPSTRPAERFPITAVLRMLSLLARWWMRGDGRRSPLRDESGAPRVTPRVLSAEELAAARARAAHWVAPA